MLAESLDSQPVSAGRWIASGFRDPGASASGGNARLLEILGPEGDLQGRGHASVVVARQGLRLVEGTQHGLVPLRVAAGCEQSRAEYCAVRCGSHLHLRGRVTDEVVGEDDVRPDAGSQLVTVAGRGR